MGENIKIISGQNISATTYFDVKDFFSVLRKWFSKNNYVLVENFTNEYVGKDSRNILYRISPFRNISDYTKFSIEMDIALNNVKEVTVEKNKHKIKLSHGEISIDIDAFIVNDHQNRWQDRPLYYFFRIIADKFIFTGRSMTNHKILAHDIRLLKKEIKAYLNLKRFE